MKVLPVLTGGVFVAAMLTMSACKPNSGSEYIGTWHRVSGRGPEVQVIEKHGDLFIVKDVRVASLMGQGEEQYPATLKDGALHIEAGIVSYDLRIDKTTGHLIEPGIEYERVKN